MVKTKAQSKKRQKRGIDFKKIKRKIGRKLPPPKNATNTEIKSKAIVLPEQSVASEKAGLAISRKCLTLKELLQQTSHHNSKVRKDALIGIKDIFLKHPGELKLHKLAVIEKLRVRIGDDDKLVRETLYELFKSVIFPGCKEDNQGPLISLMMAYIFNAMTHLAIDVRLMAFSFFDLVVQYNPSSFSLYAEKILQNYEDILRKNQIFLEDKSKLKNTFGGLVHCLSLLPCDEGENDSSNTPAEDLLHAFEPEVSGEPTRFTEVTKKLKDLLPRLVTFFQDFMPMVHTIPQLDAQSFDSMLLILQSIDLVVRFLVCGIGRSRKYTQTLLPPSQKPDTTTCDQFISLAMLKKSWDIFPLSLVHHQSKKDDGRIFMLNIVIAEIILQLSIWNYPSPALLEKLLEFIEGSLSTKTQSNKGFNEKHLLPLISYIPKLAMGISGHWRSRILRSFTEAFMNCNPESSMKLACLSTINEMLDPEKNWLYMDRTDPTILDYQITWIRELAPLLTLLGDKNPTCSKAVLSLQLRLGQAAPPNSPFSQEFDNMQYIIRDFYSSFIDERSVSYGPFIRLSEDVQEISICCLYYFSFMDSLLLQSLVSCCLCPDLEPYLLLESWKFCTQLIELGISKLLTTLAFSSLYSHSSKFIQKRPILFVKHEARLNRGTYKSITSVVCSCLSQMVMLISFSKCWKKIVVDLICAKKPVDNMCGLLRLLVTFDSKPSRLSEESIINISHTLPEYLMDIAFNDQEDDHEPSTAISVKRKEYYLLPPFLLFHRSNSLLSLVLNVMGSWVSEICSLLCAIISMLLLMHEDIKIQRILSSCKMQIKNILQNLSTLLPSVEIQLTIREKREIQSAHDQLKAVTREYFRDSQNLGETASVSE
ncbi:testis-expressed sequence 10 homolog isoform X1 [Olea europaea subsp. europaea]|uniref:Testis-expressed sequence 10 homolog isoform X1 n=1 Tax=Olea europaea subsp. europaea TaxID=158383 RepID=A0A8S0S953_OLEEU|nr:testis-expressed sequence 10 homolog isoform X1 [Olea europaea subsp. europaea]